LRPKAREAMDRKIRILFLIDQLGVGGTERQLFELMRRLDSDKFEVFLGCLSGQDSGIPEFLPIGLKVRTIILNVRSTNSLAALVGIWRLALFIRSESIDIVQYYFIKSKVLGAIAGKFAGAVTVSCMRDLGMHITAVTIWHLKVANSCSDRFLANSLRVKHHLMEVQGVCEDYIDVIPNGVDVDKYQPVSREERARAKVQLGIDPDHFVVGAIANLKLVKGLVHLVRAASVVCRQREKVLFVIVGRGPQEEELRRLAVELGVSKYVIFAGGCDDVRPYLRAFDIGVLCSLSEGFSNSILEYMSSGLPVVATRVGGASEQVKSGETGILVPADDSAALAAALTPLMDDGRIRQAMAEASRDYCVKEFSVDTMINRMDDFYSRIVAR
jgi:L-malate glycosyltransferase